MAEPVRADHTAVTKEHMSACSKADQDGSKTWPCLRCRHSESEHAERLSDDFGPCVRGVKCRLGIPHGPGFANPELLWYTSEIHPCPRYEVDW